MIASGWFARLSRLEFSALRRSLARRWLGFLGLLALTATIALGCGPLGAGESEFRLLHTNDHHAHLEPAIVGGAELGGIARRKTAIERARAESAAANEPLLLLDAGDIFQGTLYFNEYVGMADREYYNVLNYDAVAIGNHDFDEGQEALAAFLDGAQFPMLGANLTIAESSPLRGQVPPSLVKRVGGRKVGIFGLTTPETVTLSDPGPGVGFADPIETARAAVADLERQGVREIIALTHLGLAEDLALAAAVDGLDLVVGGHSHTPLGNMPGAEQPYPIEAQTPNGDPVLVVTDWEWGKYLGDLRVRFDRRGRLVSWEGQPQPLDATVPPDEMFAYRLKVLAEPLEALRQREIGRATAALDGDRARLRSEEMPLGNLVADAVSDKMSAAGATVAFVNGGSIRAGLPAGTVMMGDVLEVLPFGDTICRMDVTGAQLLAALEHGVASVETLEGSFPQVAGLRFRWDPTKPAGARVLGADVRDGSGAFGPLDPAATYRVATSGFLMNGGDGYEMFKAAENRVDSGFLLADTVADYIQGRSPIAPGVEGRIVRAE